jgi:hypothetical protein
MDQHLRSRLAHTREQMRIHVAQQQHELEKQHARRPHGGGATEERQQHLANHGLTNEKEERA